MHVVPCARRRAGGAGAARGLVQVRRPGRPTERTSPSSASTRPASRTAARTRSGSCRRAVAARVTSRTAAICTCSVTGSSDLVDWEVEASDALTWDGADAVIAPLTLAGQSAVWRFPLVGEPAELAGCGPHVHGYAARGGRIVTLRSTAAGVRRSPPRGGRRPAPADARGLGLAAGADGDRLRAGLHPRPGRPDPRDGARAARRGSQGAAARALDRRRTGRELGPRALAPRLDARGRRCARADARPARLGELRPRLAGGHPRRLGRRRRRGSARLRRLGGGGGARRSRPAGRHGPLLRRLHDALADRPERPLPRSRGGQRREQPDLRGRATATRARCGRRGSAGGARRPTSSASGSSRRWRTPNASRRRC